MRSIGPILLWSPVNSRNSDPGSYTVLIVGSPRPSPLSRGTVVNRTYGTHKNLYIYLIIFTNNMWSYLLSPPPCNTIRASHFHRQKNSAPFSLADSGIYLL